MSLLRASTLVTGLAQREVGAEAREIVRRLAALETPAAIADRVLGAAVDGEPRKKRRTWRVATGLAATLAAVFGTRALGDLESFLLGGSTGFTLLPLVSLVLVALALIVPWRMQRSAEEGRRDREAARILAALAPVVPGDDAMAIAAYVAEVPRARLERRFDAGHLAQNLAVAAVTDPPSSPISPAVVSTVLVGAAAAWAIFGFWALYFVTFGQSAMVGP